MVHVCLYKLYRYNCKAKIKKKKYSFIIIPIIQKSLATNNTILFYKISG